MQEDQATTEAELRAVFGRRSDYYVAQWQGRARRASNWAAFGLSGLWLPYRRLYGVALIFYAALVVETTLETLIFSWLGYSEVPRIIERAVGLVAALVCGMWGNRWYFARVRRVIAETRARALPDDEHLRELSRRGGTRPWHAAAFVLLFAVMLFAAMAVLTVLEEA